jgi:hypothetical protein
MKCPPVDAASLAMAEELERGKKKRKEEVPRTARDVSTGYQGHVKGKQAACELATCFVLI